MYTFSTPSCHPDSMTTVKRMQCDGSTVVIPCPQAVAVYNSGMGGVDTADHRRNFYSCSRKSHKWWPRIFWFLVDVSIVNAHILESLSPNHIRRQQKDFRVELAYIYLRLFCARGTPGRKSLSPSQQTQPLAGGHWPSRLEKRHRCTECREKEVRSWYYCPTCNVGLCPECFQSYHDRLDC